LVYAWTGEPDRALEQLEKVATIPGHEHDAVTCGDLRFNPCWDSLRGDKRFDKIVAAAKAASKEFVAIFRQFVPAASYEEYPLGRFTTAIRVDATRYADQRYPSTGWKAW